MEKKRGRKVTIRHKKQQQQNLRRPYVTIDDGDSFLSSQPSSLSSLDHHRHRRLAVLCRRGPHRAANIININNDLAGTGTWYVNKLLSIIEKLLHLGCAYRTRLVCEGRTRTTTPRRRGSLSLSLHHHHHTYPTHSHVLNFDSWI